MADAAHRLLPHQCLPLLVCLFSLFQVCRTEIMQSLSCTVASYIVALLLQCHASVCMCVWGGREHCPLTVLLSCCHIPDERR